MLMTLILAALAAAVVELLVPHLDGGRMAAYVRMIGGLFLLVVLIAPVTEAVTLWREAAEGELNERLPEAFLPAGEPTDYTAVWRETLAATGEAAVTKWVQETLAADFAISAEEATVSVVCTVSDATGDAAGVPVVQEVRIALSGGAILQDPRRMEAVIGEALGCLCFVTVG